MLTACEGPEGPMGPAGPQGIPGQNGRNGQDGKDGRDGSGTKWFSIPITVQSSEWGLTNGNAEDLNSYWFAAKPLPELTKHIYDNGSVIAYIENIDGIKNGMPFVWHKGEVQNGKLFLWTETYDYDFTVGSTGGEIGFYVTYSDFSTNIRPETKTFHVVLLWP